MTFPNLRADIHDPKTLAAMDQAFATVGHMLRADDPFLRTQNELLTRVLAELEQTRRCAEASKVGGVRSRHAMHGRG